MSKTTAAGARPADVGFHAGELAVQRRAGTLDEAARLSPMLDPAELRGGIAAFLADRTFAVITAQGHRRTLWASPLTGRAGFLDVAGPTTLAVQRSASGRRPAARAARPGQKVGTRRRRVRGPAPRPRQRDAHRARATAPCAIEVEQAYGNCPQYIHQRLLAPGSPGQRRPGDARRG